MQCFYPVPVVPVTPGALLGILQIKTNTQPATVAAELVVEAFFIATQWP